MVGGWVLSPGNASFHDIIANKQIIFVIIIFNIGAINKLWSKLLLNNVELFRCSCSSEAIDSEPRE